MLIWTSEVLDALHAAHTAGIIHRDIKPSNLFLVHSARVTPYVKLLDFGIAKLGAAQGDSTPQTRASMLIGTPDYMSPEQARGRPISAATDLYALGCVVFELLTGERLFRGENPMQTMFMHVENPPRKVSEVVPGSSRELDDLVSWMLEKDPARRPQSAAALRNAVEGLLDTIPADAPGFEPTVIRAPASRGTPAPISANRARKVRAATPPPTTPGRLPAFDEEPDRTAIQPAVTRTAPRTAVEAAPVPAVTRPLEASTAEVAAAALPGRSRAPCSRVERCSSCWGLPRRGSPPGRLPR